VEKGTWFEMASEGERTTRQSADPLNIKPRAARLEVRRNFFSQRVVEDWNKLPKTQKNVETVNSFKNGRKEYRRAIFASSD